MTYLIGLIVGIVFTIAIIRLSSTARKVTGVHGASIGDQDDDLGTNRNNKFKQ